MIDFTRLALALAPRRTQAPRTTLEGVELGRDVQDNVVALPGPRTERASHFAVLAASGAGKTVMVAAALVDEYLDSCASGPDNAECLCVIDPKGDLVQSVLSALAARQPSALEQVRYLNPFSQGAFAFNLNKLPLGTVPIDIRAAQLASLCANVSTGTGAQRHLGAGARQIDAITHVLLAALTAEHPAANVTWAIEALASADGQRQLGRLAQSARARAFLEHTNLGEELKTSCVSRLRSAFASCEQLQRLVTAPSCLDLADLTAPRRIVLLDLGSPPGGLESLITFWANLLCRLLVEHALSRPSPFTGHHLRLVVDEAQVVAATLADVAERLLTTGRSRSISLGILSQGTTLIDAAAPTLLRVLLTNTPTKIVGRLAVGDSDLLAREQAPKPGTDEPLSAVRARLVTSVTNLPDRAFFHLQPGGRVRFTSRDVDTQAWATALCEQNSAIRAALNRLALPAEAGPRVSLADTARNANRDDRGRRQRGPVPQPRSPWG